MTRPLLVWTLPPNTGGRGGVGTVGGRVGSVGGRVGSVGGRVGSVGRAGVSRRSRQ